MTDKRIPNEGEVWEYDGEPITVVNVYTDAVTYLWRKRLVAETLEGFVESYTPPEPTVVDSLTLSPVADESGLHTFWIGHSDSATHRLDLMSDGEFRVVKL